MRLRIPALAVLSAMILAACSSDAPATGPFATLPTPSLAIDTDAFCNGATMPVIECQSLVAIYNGTGGPAWTNHS